MDWDGCTVVIMCMYSGALFVCVGCVFARVFEEDLIWRFNILTCTSTYLYMRPEPDIVCIFIHFCDIRPIDVGEKSVPVFSRALVTLSLFYSMSTATDGIHSNNTKLSSHLVLSGCQLKLILNLHCLNKKSRSYIL